MGLRIATENDIPFLLTITQNKENFAFIDSLDKAALQGHMAKPSSALVIWEHDGKPEGFCLYWDLNSVSDRIYIDTLALARPSSGLGRMFLQDLVTYGFEDLNARRLWLSAAIDNPRAIRAYERVGFQQEGVMREHWKRPSGDFVDLMLLGMMRVDWSAQ